MPYSFDPREVKTLKKNEVEVVREMLSQEGLTVIVVSCDTQVKALEDGLAVPRELEEALVEAQQGMKRETKALYSHSGFRVTLSRDLL